MVMKPIVSCMRVKVENEALVKYLVEHGGDINKEDRYGYEETLLHNIKDIKNEKIKYYLE